MTLSYDVPLVPGAELVLHANVPTLGNLTVGRSDLDLDRTSLAAQREVLVRLEGRGVDWARLTNGDLLARPIAFVAVADLAQAGLLPDVDGQGFLDRAWAFVDGFRARYPDPGRDEPRVAVEGVPVVRNVHSRPVLS